jgi:serine/threonine protein phosphatase PrpC
LTPYKIVVYGLSDIGLARDNNEDVWAELPDEKIYVLADGMGGHQAGEVAASEAVFSFCEIIRKLMKKRKEGFTLEEMKQAIRGGVELVNQIIYEMGIGDEALFGMGTTLCCLHFHPDGLIYAHVGDSRIYRYREGRLKQMTKDHSLLREMVEMGCLTEDEAKEFLFKNIITKAVGTEPFVSPAVEHGDVLPGDIYLMCTDGLTDLLTTKNIEKVVKNSKGLRECAESLVQAAKDLGGYDNITVVLVKVET